MKCPECQIELPDDAKFCNACGKKLEVLCLECGRKLTAPEHSRKPKDLSCDEKLAKIQEHLPSGLTEETLLQRDRVEGGAAARHHCVCGREGVYSPHLTARTGRDHKKKPER